MRFSAVMRTGRHKPHNPVAAVADGSAAIRVSGTRIFQPGVAWHRDANQASNSPVCLCITRCIATKFLQPAVDLYRYFLIFHGMQIEYFVRTSSRPSAQGALGAAGGVRSMAFSGTVLRRNV